MEFKLKAITDIWTGGVDGKTDKLHLTGIKGSIRWWYEALIRGLNGYACDPTSEKSENKCTFDIESNDIPEALNSICSVCHLFGCTGWSGKFILRITDNENKPITHSLKKDNEFKLVFIEKKDFSEDEKKILNATIKLIVEYGSIGGKTTLKPSETSNNYQRHHLDYGLITYQDKSLLKRKYFNNVPPYVNHIKDNNPDRPDLKHFWFIKGGCISRDKINTIVGRDIRTGRYQNPDELQVFLGGYNDKDRNDLKISLIKAIERRGVSDKCSESKKIFSFHGQSSGKSRCWGYTRQSDYDKTIKLIKDNVSSSINIKRGTEVINVL